MDARVRALIRKAEHKYGPLICPCANKTWEQCVIYNEIMKEWWLWFNTADGSTHTIS